MTKRSRLADYPPLLVIGVGLLIVLAVLPSSLNFPQSNPTETLEYAPVPPDDADNPPPAGNLGSLGLGTSSGVTAAGATPPPVAPIAGRSKDASAKRCVGSPPHQTEDPFSPPCVAFFDGDNFGATYVGVSREEIRILVYVNGGFTDCVTARGCETRPTDTYYDLASEPQQNEHHIVRMQRLHQRYFNERYQTYGRYVHFFVYFGNGNLAPETRRAEAVENLERVKPFAIMIGPQTPDPDPYIDVMARHGVLVFSSLANKPAEFFRRYPRLVWSYLPSIEEQAKVYSSFVCDKVVGKPVSVSGNPTDQGKARRLGFLHTTDVEAPGMQLFASIVKQQIMACGGEFVADRTFPYAGYAVDARTTGDYAVQNIAAFAQQRVTTVIWAQGFEIRHSAAAANIGYRPEWIIAGDATHESYETTQRQEQSVWNGHAWVVTSIPRKVDVEQTHCFQALRETDPDAPIADVSYECGLTTDYEDLRLMFTGIQVAGPRLGPHAIDEGLHAIPPVLSTDPQVPACFFRPGDYTCVKDAEWMWWDRTGKPPSSNQPGCWRMVLGGRRFIAGRWPDGNVDVQRRTGDPCNNHAGNLLIRTG